MAYSGLQHFIQELEKEQELIRITASVSPHLEISEITDRISKAGGKALLFENTATDFPLLINAFGSEKRMALALGVADLNLLADDMEALFRALTRPHTGWWPKLQLLPQLKQMAGYMPRQRKGKGACQEVIMEKPDLTKLPVLTCWPQDGGAFLTLPAVHTVDLNTGIRNLGMYRMQVFGSDLTGMHWHLHKNSARHYREYKAAGKKMPVTVTLGGDPAYTYSATAPLPDNVDEYMLAGYLRKKRVELVKCLTNELSVPADVDFVIEGYVDPAEELILEGPFGDHTGYYSLADYYPRFHVSCITHRKNAVYPATLVGVPPQEDAWLGKATERLFIAPIRMTMLPEIKDMVMPVEGVFHNITLIKIDKTYAGQGTKVMNALWGAGQMMFNKIMVVVSREIDLNDYMAVLRIIEQTVDPVKDVVFSKGAADVLDHAAAQFALGSKIGIDATDKWPEEVIPQIVTDLFMRIDKDSILKRFSAVAEINDSLLQKGLSVVVLTVRKSEAGALRKLHKQLLDTGLIQNIKFILYVDATLSATDWPDVVWQLGNNIDPVRDCFYHCKENNEKYPVLAFDGTRKYNQKDGFAREWPNVVAHLPETIKRVDAMWNQLGLGPLIESPSKKYLQQQFGKNAVAD